MILDKLETGIKDTPYKRILEGIYGGKKRYKSCCKNCGHVWTTNDLFYNLTVKVKNIKTIFDSLDDHN